MNKNNFFHPEFVAAVISTSERLCAENKTVFRPMVLSALGFESNNAEASSSISLMFRFGLVTGFKLSKGKNGGIRPLVAKEVKKDSKPRKLNQCSNCKEFGHNARKCSKDPSTNIAPLVETGVELNTLPKVLEVSVAEQVVAAE
jgi:hypothetical protein